MRKWISLKEGGKREERERKKWEYDEYVNVIERGTKKEKRDRKKWE